MSLLLSFLTSDFKSRSAAAAASTAFTCVFISSFCVVVFCFVFLNWCPFGCVNLPPVALPLAHCLRPFESLQKAGNHRCKGNGHVWNLRIQKCRFYVCKQSSNRMPWKADRAPGTPHPNTSQREGEVSKISPSVNLLLSLQECAAAIQHKTKPHSSVQKRLALHGRGAYLA